MKLKSLFFHDRALKELQGYSKEVRSEIGYLLHRVQGGEILKMPKSRPIPSIVKGAEELRIKMEDGWFRVFYYVKYKNKVLVFHMFKKKTNATSKKDKDTGKARFKELTEELKDERS